MGRNLAAAFEGMAGVNASIEGGSPVKHWTFG